MTEPDPPEDSNAFDRARIDAERLLPAWFVPRMMDDTWSFAFMLTNGTLVHFSTIYSVHRAANGTLWIDVELSADTGFMPSGRGAHFTAPTSRLMASINADHIVMAFETADT